MYSKFRTELRTLLSQGSLASLRFASLRSPPALVPRHSCEPKARRRERTDINIDNDIEPVQNLAPDRQASPQTVLVEAITLPRTGEVDLVFPLNLENLLPCRKCFGRETRVRSLPGRESFAGWRRGVRIERDENVGVAFEGLQPIEPVGDEANFHVVVAFAFRWVLANTAKAALATLH